MQRHVFITVAHLSLCSCCNLERLRMRQKRRSYLTWLIAPLGGIVFILGQSHFRDEHRVTVRMSVFTLCLTVIKEIRKLVFNTWGCALILMHYHGQLRRLRQQSTPRPMTRVWNRGLGQTPSFIFWATLTSQIRFSTIFCLVFDHLLLLSVTLSCAPVYWTFFPLLCPSHLCRCWPLCFPFLSFLSLPVCGVELADALPFLAERGGCASALVFTSSCSASCTGHRWKATSNLGKACFLPDPCSQINYSHSKWDSSCSNSWLRTLKIQPY